MQRLRKVSCLAIEHLTSALNKSCRNLSAVASEGESNKAKLPLTTETRHATSIIVSDIPISFFAENEDFLRALEECGETAINPARKTTAHQERYIRYMYGDVAVFDAYADRLANGEDGGDLAKELDKREGTKFNGILTKAIVRLSVCMAIIGGLRVYFRARSLNRVARPLGECASTPPANAIDPDIAWYDYCFAFPQSLPSPGNAVLKYWGIVAAASAWATAAPFVPIMYPIITFDCYWIMFRRYVYPPTRTVGITNSDGVLANEASTAPPLLFGKRNLDYHEAIATRAFAILFVSVLFSKSYLLFSRMIIARQRGVKQPPISPGA